jgi:hypothetical protein
VLSPLGLEASQDHIAADGKQQSVKSDNSDEIFKRFSKQF